MTRQLAFDLPARAALKREDFFVSPANAAGLEAVEGWRGWPGGKLVLAGPEGSGKTHLAQIWATEAGAMVLDARSLPGADLAALARNPVAVEEADRVAGYPAAEEALFHLHNLLAAGGRALLMTARALPRDWSLALPDLASRVQAAPVARLAPPDDALLSAVLIKLFADRQIAVPPSLIPYLVQRMDRSFEAARHLVGALDARALAEGRAITRAMAAEFLEAG